MNLPIKMSVPQYAVTVPSTKEVVSVRPFLVGEQKSMMLALATGNDQTIVNSIESIIEVCSNGKLSPKKMPAFDIEYLFLQLRARSIGESVALATECRFCSGEIDFKVDISRADVTPAAVPTNKIQLTQDIGVEMRYPSLLETIKLAEASDIELTTLEIATNCITSVWNSEELVSSADYPKESIQLFVDSLTIPQLKQITDFIKSVPRVKLIHSVTCPHCSKENKVLIEGIENFFG